MSKKKNKKKGKKPLKVPKLLSIVPEQDQPRVLSAFQDLQDISKIADVESAFKTIDYLHKTYTSVMPSQIDRTIEKNYAPIAMGTTAIGFDAAGSVLRRLYPHPFQMFAFIADNYWPARACRWAVIDEVNRDGWVLVAKENIPKYQIKAAYNVLKDIDIDEKRLRLIDTLGTFGNAWVLNTKNAFGGFQELECLLPERMVPDWDRFQDKVTQWIYLQGTRKIVFNLDEVDHIKNITPRSNVMGNPCLAPVVVDVEAAMHSSVYNNTLMQKGGLIQAVIALGKMETSSINDKTSIQTALAMQKYLDKRFSGVRAGGGLAVIPNVENIHILNKIQEMDTAFKNQNNLAELRVCSSYGVPPERIFKPRGSQYRNTVEIADSTALAFDNRIFYLVKKIDEYINTKIIQEYLGIRGIRLQQRGEFNSLTKTVAEVAAALAQAKAGLMSVDEFRVRLLHFEPFGGELGRVLIGSMVEDPVTGQLMLPTILAPENPDVEFINAAGKGYKRYLPSEIELF